MMRSRRSLLGFVGLSLMSCASAVPYQLPLNGMQARSTFPRLAMCAKARNLQAVEQAESFNVHVDAETWIQFMVQGEQYNMVVNIDGSVPEGERMSRCTAARQLGDALFACSMGNGMIAPTGTPGAIPPSPFENGMACVSAAGPSCSEDGQCESQNCTNSVCQARISGSVCRLDAHCDSRNCVEGCCQTRSAGALCGTWDNHCDSLNCTNGRCQPRTIGSFCGNLDSHCDSLNCTNGRCQPRTSGAACGIADSHCESFNCVEGVCK